MDRPSDFDLLVDYLLGELNSSERARVQARLATDPEWRAELARLRELWNARPSQSDREMEQSIEAGWLRLVASIDRGEVARPLPVPPRPAPSLPAPKRTVRTTPFLRSRRTSSRPLQVAASVLLLVAAGIGYRSYTATQSEEAVVEMREFVASSGSPLSIRFGDGSTAVLAPGSLLRAPTTFAMEAREVEIRGRAYFAVTSDTARPFAIRSGGMLTRVLGTEFDVRDYPGTTNASVTVRSGRVSVRPIAGSSDRLLTAGERGTVSGDSVIVESGVDVDASVGWTHGSLVFRATPLQDAIPELEGWLGLEIDADSALATRRITATFYRESPDAVLRNVALLVRGRFDQSGERVLLTELR